MTSQNSSEPARIEPLWTPVPARCEKHGDFEARRFSNAFSLPPITTGCPMCAQERAAEDRAREIEQVRRAEQYRIAVLFGRSGIPKRFQDRTLENFITTVPAQARTLAIARSFVDAFTRVEGASLILCGKPGTGKTHIACGIAHAIIDGGKSAVFATVLSAIRHIKDTYRKDSERSESDAVNDFLASALLVLDEVGAQVGSEHEKLLLFEIINERYQRCLSTILISNLTQDELGVYLGDRVMDRFREDGGIVAFDWDSHRGTREPQT